MSKIQFEQLSETELEVSLPAETPMEMVQELTKSLIAKGLVEDLKKSTLSTRYFYRPKDKVNTLADRLLKTLEDMDLEKAKKHWWADSQAEVDAWKQKNQAIDRADRAKAAGHKIPTATPAPVAPATPSAGRTLPGVPNKVHNPETSVPVDYYRRNTQKNEDVHKDEQGCTCSKCETTKSETLAEKIKKKANLNKSTWANHKSIPSAEEQIMKYASEVVNNGEDMAANQLAKMMQNKQLLKFNQPSNDEFTAAGESMGLGVSEEVFKSEQQGWNNTMNSWLVEATKPISNRFASEEEEIAYWSKIKVADRKDDDTGY